MNFKGRAVPIIIMLGYSSLCFGMEPQCVSTAIDEVTDLIVPATLSPFHQEIWNSFSTVQKKHYAELEKAKTLPMDTMEKARTLMARALKARRALFKSMSTDELMQLGQKVIDKQNAENGYLNGFRLDWNVTRIEELMGNEGYYKNFVNNYSGSELGTLQFMGIREDRIANDSSGVVRLLERWKTRALEIGVFDELGKRTFPKKPKP